MEKFLTVVVVSIAAIATVMLLAFVTGLIVMLLWNWIMPIVFGLTKITYLQGWGIAALTGILFNRLSVKSEKE